MTVTWPYLNKCGLSINVSQVHLLCLQTECLWVWNIDNYLQDLMSVFSLHQAPQTSPAITTEKRPQRPPAHSSGASSCLTLARHDSLSNVLHFPLTSPWAQGFAWFPCGICLGISGKRAGKPSLHIEATVDEMLGTEKVRPTWGLASPSPRTPHKLRLETRLPQSSLPGPCILPY